MGKSTKKTNMAMIVDVSGSSSEGSEEEMADYGPLSTVMEKSEPGAKIKATPGKKLGDRYGGLRDPKKKPMVNKFKNPARFSGPGRHNSTNTLYVKSTLHEPSYDELLKVVAARLVNLIKIVKEPAKDIFNEILHPIERSPSRSIHHPPSNLEVGSFLTKIFKQQKLAHECLIMSLVYIDRVLSNPKANLQLNPQNWRRILLASLVIASKVWEDLAVWNVDFVDVFPELTFSDLNEMERNFLGLLEFDVTVIATTYASYYFNLRELADVKETWPLKPLDKDGEARLALGGKRDNYDKKTAKMVAVSDDWSRRVTKMIAEDTSILATAAAAMPAGGV